MAARKRSSHDGAHVGPDSQTELGSSERGSFQKRGLFRAFWEPGKGKLDFLLSLDLSLWPRSWDDRSEKDSWG